MSWRQAGAPIPAQLLLLLRLRSPCFSVALCSFSRVGGGDGGTIPLLAALQRRDKGINATNCPLTRRSEPRRRAKKRSVVTLSLVFKQRCISFFFLFKIWNRGIWLIHVDDASSTSVLIQKCKKRSVLVRNPLSIALFVFKGDLCCTG